MLAACLCGALFCTQVSAKVCFVGDPDCTQGAEFEEYTPPATDNLCTQEGYNKNATDCLAEGGNIGGVCPYDASFVKCCGAEYAYQACVFPLENVSKGNGVDKCGSLYKCQCNEEYKTPADWAKEASSACQPGGGVCILSTDTTVRYNKCICDVNYFPYENSCPSNTTEIDSCTDSEGKTRKSCQCPNTYKTCTYGGAPGADTCMQGGITLYSSCNTPEQECINAGYYDNCSQQKCYYDTQNMEQNEKTYPIACENSNEVCPYMFGYYFCRWSPLNFCKAKHADMIEYSPEEAPEKCTKDGIEGTVIPCRFGYNGEGNRIYTENKDFGKYLGYYRCKLTCEQQARGNTSVLYPDPNFGVNSKGEAIGYYRRDTAGNYHAYILGEEDTVVYFDKDPTAPVQGAPRYASINGMGALYDIPNLGKEKFDDCANFRKSYQRPSVKFAMGASGDYFDRDFSDIKIVWDYGTNGLGVSKYIGNGASESNKITRRWRNVTFQEDTTNWPRDDKGGTSVSRSCHRRHGCCDESADVAYYRDKRNIINLRDWTKLLFEGETIFSTNGGQWNWNTKGDCNNAFLGGQVYRTNTTFYGNRHSLFMFTGIDSKKGSVSDPSWDWDDSSGFQWDTDGNGGTIVFKNVDGNFGTIFSYYNVGLENSDIDIYILQARGKDIDKTNKGSGLCRGVSLLNSKLTVLKTYPQIWDGNLLYIGNNSTFTSNYPLRLKNRRNAVVCLKSSSSKLVATDRRGRKSTDTGMSNGWIKYGFDRDNLCFPSTCTNNGCDDHCATPTESDNNTLFGYSGKHIPSTSAEKVGYVWYGKFNDGYCATGAYDRYTYWKGGISPGNVFNLCSGCYNCEKGIGYIDW